MNIETVPESTISDEALLELPIFPLPGMVLLPRTLVSLHIFEPRYRKMMEDVIDGHRVLGIAMLDEEGAPDAFGRPPIHRVAGVGILRRSARLPDGRFNIVLEGALRADVSEELAPGLPYRRARARAIADELPGDPRELESMLASVRGLCAQLAMRLQADDAEVLEKLNEVTEAGPLADMVAAAVLQDSEERQRILEEANIGKRLERAASSLASLLLKAEEDQNGTSVPTGWGIGTGKA
jgi:Lon protease-like protein